jgi:hypothetical protein
MAIGLMTAQTHESALIFSVFENTDEIHDKIPYFGCLIRIYSGSFTPNG